jgi:hypothetical protein
MKIEKMNAAEWRIRAQGKEECKHLEFLIRALESAYATPIQFSILDASDENSELRNPQHDGNAGL